MYISRVEVDNKNRRKIRDLSHLGAYHNWVERCFPEEFQEGKRNRHLWRIDKLNGRKYLLILSNSKPNKYEMERYGVKNTAQTKDYLPFLNRLQNGQLLHFRLTANPTHRYEGKVVAHVTVKKQKEWLIRKAKKSGFELKLNQFDIVDRGYSNLFKKGNSHVRLSKVTYEGLLKVTDLDLFKRSLIAGVGREKAFGMGLLTVIPVN